jgi:acetyl-CoA synthetase
MRCWRLAAAEKDVHMAKELPKVRPFCPAESLDSEDPLFLLYTSGELLLLV